MFSFLVAIIYIAFVSLGLPDSLLGCAWPSINAQLNQPISYMGIVSMIITLGTILSSLGANWLCSKVSTGVLTAFSVMLTAICLFAFSFSSSFWQLCVVAFPYGLGAGAVDAGLNNYAALHFSSRQTNWLHCFWGFGAVISPSIMGGCLTAGFSWNLGYRLVGLVQIAFTAFLFVTLPLWKRATPKLANGQEERLPAVKTVDALKVGGVWQVLVLFFAYCSLEQTTFAWSASYMVKYHAVSEEVGAFFASSGFVGITLGRFVCGLFSAKVGDKTLVRVGICFALVGIALVGLSFTSYVFAIVGLVVVGIGCAPVYPAIIHSTPSNFGRENSQAIVGMQMACAYAGSAFMPPLFGVIAEKAMGVFPLFLAFFALLSLVMSERVNKLTVNKRLTIKGE